MSRVEVSSNRGGFVVLDSRTKDFGFYEDQLGKLYVVSYIGITQVCELSGYGVTTNSWHFTKNHIALRKLPEGTKINIEL